MPGSAAIKKRCRDDESLKVQDSVIEAASALAVLSQSPPSSPQTSGSELSESDSDTEANEATSKTTDTSAAAASKEKSAVSFPQKLMEMLAILESESSDGSMSDQPISWLPGGDGFIISDPNEFTLRVLPRFFSQRVEFSSFTRKLYWWGFRKVTRGAGTDAFHHDCFLKADPSLCRKMKGKPRRKPTKSKSLSKQAIAKSKSSDKTNINAALAQDWHQSQAKTISLPSFGTPNNTSTSAVLPVHKNIAFGNVANPTGQTNVAAAANLLLNNSSPLVAATALRLQHQQQQQNVQAAATQAAIQQLVLNHTSVTNQALNLAATNAQQQQQFLQPTQQQVNIAAYLASLQRGGAATLQPGVVAAPAQQFNLAAQQLQGVVAAPAPVPPIQLPGAAAVVAPTASSPPAPIPVPGSQIVIHVHHMPDGSVTFTQGNGPNANSA